MPTQEELLGRLFLVRELYSYLSDMGTTTLEEREEYIGIVALADLTIIDIQRGLPKHL